ncbi:conserved protein of unknown function [Burkholderia multivorans]
MSSGATHARAVIDAWRERGADRVDPVRFRFIDALDRRAARHGGEARRILDDRLSRLMADYAADIARADAAGEVEGSVRDAGDTALPDQPARGALAGLVDYIASHAPAGGSVRVSQSAPRSAPSPEPEMLDYFRQTWSRVRADKQLRQSLGQAPRNAGPLNSSSLVHRSLSLMRELSPEYLKQFLSYVDTLSWLEQFGNGDVAAGKDAPRAKSGRKVTRSKAR